MSSQVITAGMAALRPDEGEPLREHLGEVAHGFQRELGLNPRAPRALLGMALVALASRQPEAAVSMAQASVAAAPEMGAAWVGLGQSLRACGRLTEAGAAYRSALRLDGMDALAHLGMGELRLAEGRPEDAFEEFAIAMRRDPRMAAAHMGMGHSLTYLDRFAEALAAYENALLLKPRLAEAEFAAGFVLAHLGRRHEAHKRYRRAVTLRPDFAMAWMNLGCLEREQGRDIYAEAALRHAVALRPDMAAGWVSLALLLREQGRMDEAEVSLRRAFEIDTDRVETQVAWAHFCAAQKDNAGAWGWVRWALAREPEHNEAVNSLGIVLHAGGRIAEALAGFERAEALGSVPAASNRGNALLEMGRMAEALRAHETAVERAPLNPGARYNLALTQLRLGDWSNGWRNYAARWDFREVHHRPRRFEQPRWQGEPLKGRRILLHAEQGLGDTIQFCRYARLVASRGGVPVLQVQAPVERLIRSLEVVRAGWAEVAVLGDGGTEFDVECPLMELPAVFGTTVQTVPWPGAYLKADEAATEKRAESDHVRLRVGVAWAGNPRYKADRLRSMRLKTLLPLLRVEGVEWVSLQKGEAAAQIAELAADVRVVNASSGDRDVADTAATVAGLDMVITTDTCIAHLAGAMGKEVWIMLPGLADWRWMENVETTPWYPSARLWRQEAAGDWDGVVEGVAREVRKRVAAF